MTLEFTSVHDAAGFRANRDRTRRREVDAERLDPAVGLDDYIAQHLAGSLGTFYSDDMPSRLHVHDGDVDMEAFAHGPTSAGIALRRAVKELALGDGSFHESIHNFNHGLHLRFTRTGGAVAIERVREVGVPSIVVAELEVPSHRRDRPYELAGPPRVDTTWADLSTAWARGE